MNNIKSFNQLNEEVSTPLPRPTQDSNDFVTTIETIDVDINDSKLDIEGYEFTFVKSCKVYWEHHIRYSSYGVDSIYPTIKKIELEVEVETFDPKIDDSDTEDYSFTYDNNNSMIEVENTNNLPFHPTEIEIDKMELKEGEMTDIKITF